MVDRDVPAILGRQVELGQLLANTLASVVQAQEKLDAYTLDRKRAYEAAEEGELTLPPLWYLFQNVTVELEMSVQVAEVKSVSGEQAGPHLMCRPLSPTSVSLYGHQASAGMRIIAHMAPGGPLTVKHDGVSRDASADAGIEEQHGRISDQ